MVEAESQPRKDELSGASTDGDESDVTSPRECNETVNPETRDDVLTEYWHRCQVCGRRGPEKGGLATLHVHHIERDPEGMDEHDMANLTLLCRSCHSWFHQQSTPDDSPVELTEEDQSVLLPQDIEILRYLSENGPTRTGDIVSGLPSDHSVSAVRERLWVLTGLDNPSSKAVTGRSSIRTSKPGSGGSPTRSKAPLVAISRTTPTVVATHGRRASEAGA